MGGGDRRERVILRGGFQQWERKNSKDEDIGADCTVQIALKGFGMKPE
jgi:hypothetical protein